MRRISQVHLLTQQLLHENRDVSMAFSHGHCRSRESLLFDKQHNPALTAGNLEQITSVYSKPQKSMQICPLWATYH